jgi:hypothetical protein
LNTTVLTTTDVDEWDSGAQVEAADTDKRIEIRYNKRKAKDPYYYWVYRWPAKDIYGNPVKRPSGTYVRKYRYGGKLATLKDIERLDQYKRRG